MSKRAVLYEVLVHGVDQELMARLDELSQRALCCASAACYSALKPLLCPLSIGRAYYLQQLRAAAIRCDHVGRVKTLLGRATHAWYENDQLLRHMVGANASHCFNWFLTSYGDGSAIFHVYPTTSDSIIFAMLSTRSRRWSAVVVKSIVHHKHWALLRRIVESGADYLPQFLDDLQSIIRWDPDPDAEELRETMHSSAQLRELLIKWTE